jgi:hypothetical protein
VLGRVPFVAALVLASAVVGASACHKSQTRTTIPAAWRNTEFSGVPFSKLFIIGVARNGEYRRLYENSLVRALDAEGTVAQASSALFPEDEELDGVRLLEAVKSGGFDAVVITRLKSVDEEPVYVPGNPPTSSDLYMAGYDEAYALNSDPGYYEMAIKYRLETALYSARDAMVVWVVESETIDPDSVEDIIESVSALIARQLKAEALIR